MRYTIEYWKEKGVRILDEVPKGWIKLEHTTTQPKGYSWYFNGKSLFSKEYKSVLIKNKE